MSKSQRIYEMWVARDQDEDLYLYDNEPRPRYHDNDDTFGQDIYWEIEQGETMILDAEWFPDVGPGEKLRLTLQRSIFDVK